MGRFALHGNERAGIVGGARHCELLSMADFAGRRAKRLELATRNSQLATPSPGERVVPLALCVGGPASISIIAYSPPARIH